MGYKLSDDDFKNQASLDNAIEKLGGSDVSDENGYTPLCYIALNGSRSDLIVYLVNDKDADPSKTCDKGKNPLEFACMAGNAEAVRALVGSEVVKRDAAGNPIPKRDAAGNPIPKRDAAGNPIPKRDAAGNPIPKRDDEDEIIYIKYKSGIEGIPNGIPFPLPAEVSNEQAESPVIQYTAHRVLDPEKSTKDNPVYIVDEVYKAPPDDKDHPLPNKIIYKLDKDGNHQPMRDDDGTPLKQYDRKTKKDINVTDEKGNIINKNKFEYVWDYEYLPEYETDYIEEKVRIKAKTSEVTPQHILAASSNKDPSILEAMSSKYDDRWDVSSAESTYFSSNYETPLIVACRMQALDSVKFILDKIGYSSSANIYVANPVIDAIYRTTREMFDDPATVESAYSIYLNLKDETLLKAFCDQINKATYKIAYNDGAGPSFKMIDNKMYKLLNNLKGDGNDNGNFTLQSMDKIYDSILSNDLAYGEEDDSTSLLSIKWPKTAGGGRPPSNYWKNQYLD
jgi:ankyrin repeat protein